MPMDLLSSFLIQTDNEGALLTSMQQIERLHPNSRNKWKRAKLKAV
jgi:hypothetical protein